MLKERNCFSFCCGYFAEVFCVCSVCVREAQGEKSKIVATSTIRHPEEGSGDIRSGRRKKVRRKK